MELLAVGTMALTVFVSVLLVRKEQKNHDEIVALYRELSWLNEKQKRDLEDKLHDLNDACDHLRKIAKDQNDYIIELEDKLEEINLGKELIEAHGGLSQAQDKVMTQKETIEELQGKLESAKDASIEADKEATDLRTWRRGLIKPGYVVPNRWPVIGESNTGGFVYLYQSYPGGVKNISRWFDPRDVFEATDLEHKEGG